MEFIYLVLVVILILFVHSKIMSDNTIVDIVSMMGQWAVVTGATDGIGKAFAFELAGLGYDIVLVSRNEEKLEATAQEIQKRFKVSTKIIQADFSHLDADMYSKIVSELQNMDIGVLVNNVGVAVPHPDYFLELEKHMGSYQPMINVNIVSMIEMTSAVLPRMVEKRKGLIINISSQSSKFPTPLLTVYGATKSFVKKFSEDLNTEYRGQGVNIHVLTTGFVATKMSRLKNSSFFVPTPQTYVQSALKEISRKSRCDGYIGHTLLSSVASIAVFFFPEIAGNFVLKMFNKSRLWLAKECDQCNGQ